MDGGSFFYICLNDGPKTLAGPPVLWAGDHEKSTRCAGKSTKYPFLFLFLPSPFPAHRLVDFTNVPLSSSPPVLLLVLLIVLDTEMAEVAEPLVDGGKGEIDILVHVHFDMDFFSLSIVRLLGWYRTGT